MTGNVYESRLILGHEVPKSAEPMGLTPPTENHQPVYGDLVRVANFGCEASDFPKLTGKIALISRGTCPFGTKSELAGKAGAVAAVVYNNEKGPLGGTLGTPSPYHVATFGISDADAAPYLNSTKPTDAIAYMDAVVNKVTTTNVIAQTTHGDPENCVMLGGHSDSVEAGPGINDDGSGTLSLLEVATRLTNFRVNNCVRFAWWAGEEEGLLGSDYYVSVLSSDENRKIRLFMDYDMMAGPNFAYQIYNATNAANPAGSEELRNLYIDFYESNGLNYTFIPFDGRSDYDGFIKHSIPGGGIATGAEVLKTKEEAAMFGGQAGVAFDPCYHQLCDDVGNLNATAWEWSTKVFDPDLLHATSELFQGADRNSLLPILLPPTPCLLTAFLSELSRARQLTLGWLNITDRFCRCKGHRAAILESRTGYSNDAFLLIYFVLFCSQESCQSIVSRLRHTAPIFTLSHLARWIRIDIGLGRQPEGSDISSLYKGHDAGAAT